ncbi:MAG: CgeB family protein [Aggregatilineales bacterium]
MKLLVVASSLDLTAPFSATPAWWQLLKALYEIGVDTLVTTYQGPAVESLWWRALPNPVQREGDLFLALRKLAGRAAKPSARKAIITGASGESLAERAQRRAAQTLIRPKWRAFFGRTLQNQPDVDAVLFLTAPLNHLTGVPRFIQERFHKPVIYYDGDVPASLPEFAGFASGFKIYQGADLAEYAGFISNSLGGIGSLLKMGARRADALYYGADPDVFAPIDVPQDVDVFFYGHTREYREQWIDAMIARPSERLPDAHFAVRGHGLGDVGHATQLSYLSFSKLREYACRSKLNLCVTRRAHASVLASSSSRPFELASLGACIVSNPYAGIETWFEPEKELLIVHDADEATDRYRWLLAHDAERRAIGSAARARVLKEHTFRHRAAQLVEIVRSYL